MSTYAAGFAAGEHDAFVERCKGAQPASINALPMSVASDYGRGYIAGYTPRSSTWAAMRHSPAQPVVEEIVYG